MKLVKIEDVRVGQIRKIIIMDFHAENTKEVIGVFTRANDSDYDMFDWIAEYYDVETKMSLGDYEDWTFEDCGELIGKINITHEIKDNKLVEIPRAKFQVDDVVECKHLNYPFVIYNNDLGDEKFYSFFGGHVSLSMKKDVFCENSKKIGIYGVTHEFVNDCEARND